MRRSSGLLVLALLGGCGSGPGEEPLATAEAGIAGGVLDRNHREVFQVVTYWGQGRAATCTGTLIAPNLVVTARHCLAPTTSERVVCGEAPFDAPVSPDSVAVTNAATPAETGRFFRGAAISVPSEGNDICGFDMALITLSESVPASLAVPAIPRLDRLAELGEAYAAFGYGEDARGNATQGRMRLEGLEVMCLANACADFGVAPGEFLGQEGVCAGDSGGPALDLEGKVLGTLSRGSDPCSTPVYASTTAFPEWLMATALEAAERGGYEAPLWARTGSSERPPGAEGESCWPAGSCQEGSACYYASDPTEASCTRVCSTEADCSGRALCVTGFDVPDGGLCIGATRPAEDPPREAPSNGGCSLYPASPDGAPAALLSIFAFALVLRRRERNSGRARARSWLEGRAGGQR